MKVGEQRAESDWDRQTELNEEILHVLLVDATLEPVEPLEEVGKEGEEFLVQEFVTP